MGLMDKVKPLASQLAQKSQEAATEGKARLDQVQAARRGDALLRNLGATVYADRTGRGTGDAEGKVNQLVSDISVHEQANGLNFAGNRFQAPSQRQGSDGGTENRADPSASVPEQPGATPQETDTGLGA